MSTGDFSPIFEAARDRRLHPEAPLYRPDELPDRPASFVYTPFTALVATPLAGGDLRTAANAVSILNHVLALAAFVLIVLTITRNARPGWRETLVYGLHYVAFYPLAKALQLTQASVWIFFFLTLSVFLLSRKRTAAAGLALALGVSIKPHLVFIPLLLVAVPGFPRRLIGSCLAGLTVTGGLSLWYAGLDNIRLYVFEALPVLSNGSAYFPNQSVNGLLLRAFTSADPAAFSLGPAVPWINTFTTLFGLGVLALALLACRRRRTTGLESDLLCYGIAITASVLASPLVWEHHFTALLMPFALVVRRLRNNPEDRTPVLDAALLVSYVLVSVFVDTRYAQGWLALFSGFQLYGSLVFLGCLVWLMWRPGLAAHRAPAHAAPSSGALNVPAM
jgi:hypothetical protein